MIKVSMQEIVAAAQAFPEIMERQMSGKLALQIARVAREVNKEYETYQTARQKLIELYCEKDDNDRLIITSEGQYTVPEVDVANFNKEMRDLINLEVDLNVEKISSEILEMDFMPKTLMAIDSFLE